MFCVNAYPVFMYRLQCTREIGVVCVPVGFRLMERVWPFQQHSQGSCFVSTQGSGGWIKVYAGSYRVLITTQMELLDYKQSSPCVRFLCHVQKPIVHCYCIIYTFIA